MMMNPKAVLIAAETVRVWAKFIKIATANAFSIMMRLSE